MPYVTQLQPNALRQASLDITASLVSARCCLLRRKLTELEDQISRASAGRARHAAGIDCLCCTLVLHRFQLPDYLRAWEL